MCVPPQSGITISFASTSQPNKLVRTANHIGYQQVHTILPTFVADDDHVVNGDQGVQAQEVLDGKGPGRRAEDQGFW